MPYSPLGCFDIDAMVELGYPVGSKHTYIIEMAGQGLVKIGKASDVWKRIDQLQVGNPFKLELVEWLLGDVEAELHREFDVVRVRGEWFRYTPEIDAAIQAMDAVPTTFGRPSWFQMRKAERQ
jgi:hypothetical protein